MGRQAAGAGSTRGHRPTARAAAAPRRPAVATPAAAPEKAAKKSKPKEKRGRSPSSESSTSSEDSRRPKKKKKHAKRKAASPAASSVSESSDSSDSSKTDESSSESSLDDSRKKKKAEKSDKEAKWQLLNDIWPVEMRPRRLQDRRYVNRQSWRTLHALQDRYEKEAERKGFGAAIFGTDQRLKKVKFGKKADDGYEKLHPARWLRLPMAAPEKYWRKVPRAHEQRFRHVQLAHYGAESQINEKIILGLHDRQVCKSDVLVWTTFSSLTRYRIIILGHNWAKNVISTGYGTVNIQLSCFENSYLH